MILSPQRTSWRSYAGKKCEISRFKKHYPWGKTEATSLYQAAEGSGDKSLIF